MLYDKSYACCSGPICMIPCRLSSYCPSPLLLLNGFCLTTAYCPTESIETLGCGGSSFEYFCPNQFYCPNSSTKISCQNQTIDYCPSGIINPINCRFTCKDGILNNRHIWFVVVLIVLIVFGSLIISRVLQGIWQRCINSKCCKRPSAVNARLMQSNPEMSRYFREKNQINDCRFRMSISLNEVCLNIPTWDRENDGFSGIIKDGQITAVMGQSGCGKTSLLYALQGRQKPAEGEIFIDGHNLLKTELSNYIGYVPQEIFYIQI
ncbi:unnamed protein product [Didymodactylos carnosus]|uniref:ABC transporter domain-containing protein n=1 Tax=Didymodactylos carnosus TaxID=1234261 RepID=A0A8S2VAA9_9BILA|nr:unnamed protein product [Didymodactylos carnosus]CAF4380325.1 unnamed protein product [Didymodactylos carnosus]